MLPRLLCEQLCSLNPDEDRLAFSVEWIISETGEVIKHSTFLDWLNHSTSFKSIHCGY